MQPLILIITSSFDKTCDYLQAKYKSANFFRFNTDLFYQYHVSFTANGFSITNESNFNVNTLNCSAIYYRKPAHQSLSTIIDKHYHNFTHRECLAFIDGITDSFDGVCLSQPSRMRVADNKILQVKAAKSVGFTIPEFSICNNSDFVNKKENDTSIVKPLASGHILKDGYKEIIQTNLYDSSVVNDALAYTPVYFQSYQEKDYEVRLTIVNKKGFCVKIVSDNQVDWRKLNNKIMYETIDTPDYIFSMCLDYMKFFSLRFGCFDFIVKDGRWYFLEMNANGQWLWLEFETKLPISDEIMRALGHDSL